MDTTTAPSKTREDRPAVRGGFVDLVGERYYLVEHADQMPPFFISVVSDDDHWLFVSSTGGLTAGRVSPQNALFPYITVDKLHESADHTGCRTLLRVATPSGATLWEPFNPEHAGSPGITRNIYKNILGNKLCFEEIHHALALVFRYTWMTSREYGFVRRCELENRGDQVRRVELLDGLQNILPANTPQFTQTNVSNLVDAYKWNELDPDTGLALLTLYSTITDRAEPSESLKATTVFSLGLERPTILLSSRQAGDFKLGLPVEPEFSKRGVRGAYLVNATVDLAPGGMQQWQLVMNANQSQKDVVALRQELRQPASLHDAIAASVEAGSDRLARIQGAADGFQATAEEHVSVHHYANVLFNVMRGGIFFDQYAVRTGHFARTVRHFNRVVYDRNRELLESLPARVALDELLARVRAAGDDQLVRLASEYLPITFSRRHGDPSRPWNQFAIRLRDDRGKDLLAYEGNWRDIFQNWEALALSYPAFVDSMITKFVNASTMDGYNPYRISQDGIDWEVEDPDDPWSYIGYWGDHQIIYLLKLLELSRAFYPDRLQEMLRQRLFCYANVPYRIESLAALLQDPQNTIRYDEDLARQIEQRVEAIGADGKLVLDGAGDVQLVTLMEKLLVPLLAKLGNLVLDGGIWLNTQRPEWNDANNALVGYGLSMVTLCYMRRYAHFLAELLDEAEAGFTFSAEVGQWLAETGEALAGIHERLGPGPADGKLRYEALIRLGKAASHYRETVYRQDGFAGQAEVAPGAIRRLLDHALALIDRAIRHNRREDGLFHAYNLMDLREDSIEIETLYPMLEGQVAALSAGTIAPREAAKVLETLFSSDLYRADQDSFLLYPDRRIPGFLEKNRIPAEDLAGLDVVQQMLAAGDERIILRDAEGTCRFSADFRNGRDLDAEIDRLVPEYGAALEAARPALRQLFEAVFQHRAFTGRSGTMFAFEGLGSIYWHMVAKLLLAAQENFFAALDQGGDPETMRRLGRLYYRVRAGIGFNKRPSEYGAFPTDPYSHTPRHAGAQQPGMTGQVKEEILTRFGELGLRVRDGVARFEPALLKQREFSTGSHVFRYLDVDGTWQELELPAGTLAFTWCQVPVVYRIVEDGAPELRVTRDDGAVASSAQAALTHEDSGHLFARDGRVRRIDLSFNRNQLFA